MKPSNGSKTVRRDQPINLLLGCRRVDCPEIRPMWSKFRFHVAIKVDVAQIIFAIIALIAALTT